ETAKLMEIREEVLYKELNQSLQRKQKEAHEKRINQPQTLELVKEEKVSINPRTVVEEEIIHLIMQYGNLVVELKDDEGETYATTVIEEILHQFESNDLKMENEIYQSIFEDVKLGYEEQELRTGDFFIKLFDEGKNGIASEAMMEKYSLSENWKNKLNIHIKAKEENISKDISDTILRYKTFYLDDLIKEFSETLKMDDIEGEFRMEQLEKIMILIETRSKIYKALNRVI